MKKSTAGQKGTGIGRRRLRANAQRRFRAKAFTTWSTATST
jgi:hypothetical protein